MATKTKEFEVFGVKYRTRQFAAVPALEIMSDAGAVHPVDNLRLTEVWDENSWHALDSREAVNKYVVDKASILPPRMVLIAVLKLVNEFSFGFVSTWRGVRIPKRFTSGGEVKSSTHVDPIISNLLQEDVASLRELEEYYSLEDAFTMFDVMVAKGVNEALAHEAAMKDRK